MRIHLFEVCLVAALACSAGCEKNPPTPDAKTDVKADANTETAPEPARVEAGGTITIEVDATGYRPAEIHAPPNATITLAFKRVSEQGCGEELMIKGTEIKKQLPVGEVVEIEIQTPDTGEVGFACGMDMYRGKVVVKR